MALVTAFRAPPAEEMDEREVRVQLAACYRLVAHFGMTDLAYTHISARVPGEPGHFLINPYGVLFNEMTASCLVKIDHNGEAVDGSSDPINKAGFVIHSAVHQARPDVFCVLHTHSENGVAVACLEEGLLPLNQHAMLFHGDLAYHDYEGIALDFDERERLAADLGDKRAMILRNHGLLTACPTIAEAFEVMYYLEKACKIQLKLMAAGRPIRVPSIDIAERTNKQFATGAAAGTARSFPGLMRMLDAMDPSYRN
jgi:ribulose-5-phosphate 4-epimerase/fuculose-1-phosphate aldolase